jgi:hypothetical protein
MRRVLMVFTVAALMAAMMVSAGPAQAQANEADFENSTSCLQGGDFISCGFGDDDFDNSDIDRLFGIGDFDGVFGIGDFGDDVFGEGDSDNSLSVFCPGGCNVDEINFPTTDFSA